MTPQRNARYPPSPGTDWQRVWGGSAALEEGPPPPLTHTPRLFQDPPAPGTGREGGGGGGGQLSFVRGAEGAEEEFPSSCHVLVVERSGLGLGA